MAAVSTPSDAPPAYKEKDYDAFVQSVQSANLAPLTKEDLDKSRQAVAEMVNSKQWREEALNEVKQLSRTVLQIKTDFGTIANALCAIDAKEVMPNKYAPKWDKCYEDYKTLLTNSQTTATQTKGRITDFLKVILPALAKPKYTWPDKLALLDDFAENLDEFVTAAQGNATKFGNLRDEVRNFHSNLLQDVQDEQAAVAVEIEEIKGKIGKLEQDLKDSAGFFSAAWDALKFGVPSSAGLVGAFFGAGQIAAVAGISVLAPVATIGLLGAGLSALGIGAATGLKKRSNERQEKENEIQALILKKNKLGIKQKAIEKIHMDVTMLKGTFDSIVDRLGALEAIWNMLKADAVELKTLVEVAKTSNNPILLDERMELIASIWDTVALTLDNYALGVSPNHATPGGK